MLGGPMRVRIRVISWNLHATPVAPRVLPRLLAAAAELLRRQPDLILLQEIWRAPYAAVLAGLLAPDYEPLGRTGGAAWTPPGGLLPFLRRSSGWRLRDHGFERFRAAAPAWKIWEGDGLAGKGVQTVVLERADAPDARGAPETRLVALHTHLQAAYRPGQYAAVRREQLGQLGAIAASVDARLPLLAAGDLNSDADDPLLYPEITGRFEDLSRPLRDRCGCGTVAGESRWIDYVLARRGQSWRASASVELIRSPRRDHPYSDHQGLDARVRFEPGLGLARREPDAALRLLQGPASRRAWLGAAARLLLRGAAL
jgi:endonuclease/exonuclease/phosphatase family metal-dependent hydrolase